MTEPVSQTELPAAPDAAQPQLKRRWGLWLSALTLVLIGGLGAGGYWFGWPWFQQQWQRFEVLEREVTRAAEPGPDVATIATQVADQRIQARLTSLESAWQRDLSALSARQTAERAESARQLTSRIGRVESQMDRLLAVDRRAWLGQEAVFLVRLAGQRLLVARDVDAAQALLEQADSLLRDTGEPKFEGVRLAIARDRAALAAVPVVDQVGLYARLSGLIDQVDQLQLEFESRPTANETLNEVERNWLGDVTAGWSAALEKLSGHLIIRRRSDEISLLMTPEWAALARQNIRMLIEQAQIAMLSANQGLFEQSLQRAERFVALFAEQDAERVSSILEALSLLQGEQIAPGLPDLTDTRSALEDQMKRLDRGVGQGATP